MILAVPLFTLFLLAHHFLKKYYIYSSSPFLFLLQKQNYIVPLQYIRRDSILFITAKLQFQHTIFWEKKGERKT